VHERYRISGLRKTGEKQEKWTKTSKKAYKMDKKQGKAVFSESICAFYRLLRMRASFRTLQ
jgi:hypothetical protein